jgi:uncharacterized membrane protein
MERAPRAVPASQALAWYGEAMRLWRASPGIYAALAAVTVAVELLLRLVPVAGVLLSQAVVPLFECSLLYASLAADRGDKPRLAHLLAIVGAPARAQAAVIVASLVAFAGQALCASAFAGIDLLAPNALDEPVSALTLLGIVAGGLVVSLPFTFVQPIALFDDTSFTAAFNGSLAAFARNVAPLALYAVLSLGLFLFGIVTSGLGLLLALPWLAASSYAAWKDVFAVDTGGNAPRPPRSA